MQRQVFTLSIALSLCLLVLLIGLTPIWAPHSTAASQDKPSAAEVAAAIENLQQDAANMVRSELAERKFQELNSKASLDGTVSVIVRLRVAFRPEGELLSEAGVQAQRAVIAQSQDSLMKEVTGFDPASLKQFEYTPYLAVKVSAAGLEALRLSSNVIDIHEDKLLAPSLAESAPLIAAPNMWANGYTGSGKTIAILDTGVDKNHPFLSGKVVSEACYSSNNTAEHATSLCPGGVTESTAADSGRNCGVMNDCDHGTHVAGIAAGKGPNFSGVAKDANIIAIQVFSEINDSSDCDGEAPCIRSLTSDLLKGLERVYSLRNTHSIASVNLSLGSGRFTSNCDTNPLKGIIDQLRAAGIATVIASGNDSLTNAISEPACISSAISVGATGDGTRFGRNQVANYSNVASFLTLLAPGDSITSSIPNNRFGLISGTSMAAPHVAGAWAILSQRTPGAGVTETLNWLTARGVPVTDTRFGGGVTRPRLNLGSPPACTATSVSTTRWKGEYFSNMNLEASPSFIRDEGDNFLNLDFGEGSPNGACDVGADNFSARWTRRVFFDTSLYRFTVTGDDGIRLYIDGQLKLDKWLTQPPTAYTVNVFLTTGFHDIRVEYFEAVGGALAKLSWEAVNSHCYANVGFGNWKGEYFNNTNLLGEPAMVRNEFNGFLNFNFGLGNPNPSCALGDDEFSARWTREVNFTTATYRFTVTADDGFRLYIDGQLKLDKWFIQAPTTYTTEVVLPTNLHEIKLEYFEAGGGALAQLSWEMVGPGCYEQDIPLDHWRGEYYSDIGSPGSPLMIRDDGGGFLNMNFGEGSPRAACGINADNFRALWRRWVNFEPGVYRFSVTGDDGVRLTVNGRSVIDKWFLQPPTTYTADVILGGGSVEIWLQYFEGGGGALAQLSWEKLPNDCYSEVPSNRWKGMYFNNTTLSGDPLIVRDEGDQFLNFNFGDGGPGGACNLGVDNFSARWTRRANFPTTGVYRFNVAGDDGVRLWIDGSLVINRWITQAPTIYTADVFIGAGDHEIRLEYFEGGGGALAQLSWHMLPSDCFATNVPFGHWRGNYYNNINFSGNQAMVRDDGAGFLNFDFGAGSPSAHCGLGVDNFSVTWSRSVELPPGPYRFTLTADDGVRLWVDGALVVNHWASQGPVTFTIDRTLSGTLHNILLEYFEATGGARVSLSWTQPPSP